MATARLLKDFNYYFLVILAAPFSHSKKGTILGGTEKIPPISCVPKDHFWKKNFYYFWVQTSTVKHIYSRQTTTNNSNRKKISVFTTTIAFPFVCSNTVLGFHSHSVTEKISRSRHLWNTNETKNVPLLSGVLLTKQKKNIYKKYTRNTRVKKCGESILKEEEKKVTNTIHSRKSKHSLTLNTHSHQHNAIS